MTDDLARDLAADLDKIAIPPIPNDYALLKSLIQSLPSPLTPEIRSAITGSLNTVSPSLTAAAQTQSVMAGVPIGSESGSAIGVVSEIFYGNSNLLANPLLEATDPSGDNFATTNTPFANGWQGKYVLNSGSVPSFIGTDQLYQRGVANDNPLNSTIMEMWLEASAGATDVTAYIYPSAPFNPSTDIALPFLVASIKVGWWGNTVRPHTTKFQIRMEIVDDDGALAGPWFDMKAVSGSGTIHRISVAKPKPAGGWSSSLKYPYLWRMAINWAYDQAETPAKGDWFVWGEPSLAWASTQAPPPFAPIIGGWVPSALRARNYGDISDRLSVHSGGLSIFPGSGGGYSLIRMYPNGIYMGDATTWEDLLLSRVAPTVLKISDPYGYGGGDESLQIGDDSTLFDVDIADRLGIKGQQTAANGGFVFGSGKDTNLYRSAADVLKTDDTLEVATKLVVGTETFKAVTVAVTNGSTVYFADADLPATGHALLHDNGDTGAGIVSFYRAGTFNVIKGITNNAGAYEFRGTTFSAGAGSFSFFIESNSAGARIGVKNNAGYDRSFTLVTF